MDFYPIRIDVSYPPQLPASITKEDGTAVTTTPKVIRLIDTILLDPYTYNDKNSSNRRRMIQQLAYSIVTDAYVVGVSKQQQQQPSQTAASATDAAAAASSSSSSNKQQNSNNNNNASIVSETTNTTTTTSASSSNTQNKDTSFIGRYTLIDTTTTTANTGSSSSCVDTYSITESLIRQTIQQIEIQYNILQSLHEQITEFVARTATVTGAAKANNNNNNTMITIPIQIELPGTAATTTASSTTTTTTTTTSTIIPPIRIQDEIVLDMKSIVRRNDCCSLSLQDIIQSIIHDLQLSYDTLPILTIHVMEQILCALQQQQCQNTTNVVVATDSMEDNDTVVVAPYYYDDVDEGMMMGPIPSMIQLPTTTTNPTSSNTIIQQQPTAISAAWEISTSIHTSNQTYIESFYK